MNKNQASNSSNYILGLIIKEELHGEKHKLIHVLTTDMGIVKMKASGASNLKSSTHSALGLFTYSEFSYAKGKSYYLTVTGATQKTSFFSLSQNVESFALACYFSTLAERFTTNDSSSGEILRLMLNSLYALAELKYDSSRIKPLFEAKLASICGFAPQLEQCPYCGESPNTVIFDLENFSLLCKKCITYRDINIKSERFINLTPKCINAINFINTQDTKKIFKIVKAISDEEDISALYIFGQKLICRIMEYEPKTLLLYNKIIRSLKNEKLREKQKNT